MRLQSILQAVLLIGLGLGDFGTNLVQAESTQPVPIKRTPPEYPFELRKANITGQVVVEFIVDKEGRVRNAFAVRSTQPAFNAPAVASVMQWKFKSGTVDGRVVNTRMQVPIIFSLNDSKEPEEYLLGMFRPMEKELLTKLPDEMAYDSPPKPEQIPQGVYPYPALLKNQRMMVTGAVLISTNGLVDSILWKTEGVSDEFKNAITAMMDTAHFLPAMKDKAPVATMIWFGVEFDPFSGDVRLSDTAAAILKKLRLEGDAAEFTKSKELDNKITILKKIAPVFPRLPGSSFVNGEALIETFIDEFGYAQLPRIISASDPAFGYAACQAIAGWQFEPPLKDGKPVVAKVRIPVEFKRE